MDQLEPLHHAPLLVVGADGTNGANIQTECGANKVVRKKPVMTVLDTMISVWVISPLVIAQWVGTWGLMDLHPRLFPPWESFVFGAIFHLCFAMLRENLQQLVEERGSWGGLHVLRRVYTYIFNVLSIMNWRGGWILFDEWLGVGMVADGRTAPGDSVPTAFAVAAICLAILAFLKSVKNISGVPFVICLDTKQEDFHFPTRFRIQVAYTALYVLHAQPKETDKENPTPNKPLPITPERLIGGTTIEKQQLMQIPPRPFLNDLRGTPPEAFSSTTPAPPPPSPPPPPPTPPPRNYPQIQHYRNPLYPKSIQEIIHYIGENAHNHREIAANNDAFLRNFNEYRSRYRRPITAETTTPPPPNADPFYRYKPEDPGDVNLLAASNFRFAPAQLANDGRITRHQRPIMQQSPLAANNNNLNVIREGRKPLSVTLTIYPTANTNEMPPNGMRYQRYASGPLPRRMVVHLNLFPWEGQGQGIGHFLPGNLERRGNKNGLM